MEMIEFYSLRLANTFQYRMILLNDLFTKLLTFLVSCLSYITKEKMSMQKKKNRKLELCKTFKCVDPSCKILEMSHLETCNEVLTHTISFLLAILCAGGDFYYFRC